MNHPLKRMKIYEDLISEDDIHEDFLPEDDLNGSVILPPLDLDYLPLFKVHCLPEDDILACIPDGGIHEDNKDKDVDVMYEDEIHKDEMYEDDISEADIHEDGIDEDKKDKDDIYDDNVSEDDMPEENIHENGSADEDTSEDDRTEYDSENYSSESDTEDDESIKKSCMEELERIKQNDLFCQLITKSRRPYFLANDDTVAELHKFLTDVPKCSKDFPRYGWFLFRSFTGGLKRLSLLTSAFQILSNDVFTSLNLPELVLRKILEYLEDDELETLCGEMDND